MNKLEETLLQHGVTKEQLDPTRPENIALLEENDKKMKALAEERAKKGIVDPKFDPTTPENIALLDEFSRQTRDDSEK